MRQPTLDPETIEALLESVGGDREFLAELFSTFTDEAPGLMRELEKAVRENDSERLRHVAHTLKSTSASLGALRLSEVSRAYEQAGRAGETPPEGLLPELRELVDSALAEMASLSKGD